MRRRSVELPLIRRYMRSQDYIFTTQIRERNVFTILIKGLLHLRLDLCPVPLPHGRVLQVLDQRHGAFELFNARLDGVRDLPVFVLKWQF